MARPAFALLLALACAAPSVAAPRAPRLAWAVDRTTLALGEPFTLRITRPAAAAGSLEALDFAPLQQDFEIVERVRGSDAQGETLALTLHPRRAGTLALPTFGLPGRPVQVTVTEGSDTVPRVRWLVRVEPAAPAVRQPVTLTLEACDDGSLQWRRPLLPVPEGLLLRPLGETELETTRDGERCTAHRWHWAVLPTASGPFRLALPTMDAGKFGRRLRFAPPAAEFEVLPLPAWLPAAAAVGPPEAQPEPLQAPVRLGEPLVWRMVVQGSYTAQALQDLVRLQLEPLPGAVFAAYPPQVEPLASSDASPRHAVTVFVLPRERGTLQLPALLLPWYDPQSGQLHSLRVEGQAIGVVDPARERWLGGAGAAAALAAAGLGGFGLRRAFGWRWRRHRLQRALSRAVSGTEVTTLLRGWSLSSRTAPAPTLRAWQTRMEIECESAGLQALVQRLERERFGGLAGSGSDEEMRLAARAWLASVRPRRGIEP